MKDLKHLYFFEKLLEDANNDLVREAQAAGKYCVGSVCEYTPEPLMNLDGVFSVRLTNATQRGCCAGVFRTGNQKYDCIY